MGRSRDNLVNRLSLYKDKKEKELSSTERRKNRPGAELPSEWIKAGELTYYREYVTIYSSSDPFYCPFIHPEPIRQSNIVFYDTETTGLSGGAGTRIFLTGFGIPGDNTITVKQFFLADFPGEHEYLQLISSQVRDDAFFVSFNGKGYDSHLLTSRFAVNGIPFRLPPQIDLLHPSRRLWKSIIGSCSLANIEAEILRIQREHDIPGYLVPDVYFNYLKTGDTADLLDVFHHNLQDILSLAVLLETFGGIYRDPKDFIYDPGELGRLLWNSGENRRGRDLLLQAYKEGSEKAGRALGIASKKEGDREKAEDIWRTLWNRNRDIIAGIELAKHLEHWVKDLVLAAAVVEEMYTYIHARGVTAVSTWIYRDIEKRRARLARETGGSRSGKNQKK